MNATEGCTPVRVKTATTLTFKNMNKQDKIKKVMREFKCGKLTTPNGEVVTDKKQALAIAMSESEDYAEKADLIEDISIGSLSDAEDVIKGIGSEELLEKAVYADTPENRKFGSKKSAKEKINLKIGRTVNCSSDTNEPYIISKINSNGTVDLKGKRSGFKLTSVPINRLKPDDANDFQKGEIEMGISDAYRELFGDDLEKAHQDGDMHPNGKWVWVSSANGGKGDWRKAGGRTHKKHSETQASNKFLENFKNASDDVLEKIVSGKIQAVDREKKLAQQILDSRKKSTQDKQSASSTQNAQLKKLIDDGYGMSNSQYKDISKMSISITPKGNWALYYDGKSVLILSPTKMGLDRKTLEAAGIKFDDPKKRPVGAGTNGPTPKTKADKTTPKKHSAFVTKTINKLKEALKYRDISDEHLKKLADAISRDEETAKKIAGVKFPTVGTVGPGISYDETTSTTPISSNDELVCHVSKSYITTSRGSSPYTSTKYTIYLKDRHSSIKKQLSFSSSSNSRYGKTASKAKQECVMEALLNYYKNSL